MVGTGIESKAGFESTSWAVKTERWWFIEDSSSIHGGEHTKKWFWILDLPCRLEEPQRFSPVVGPFSILIILYTFANQQVDAEIRFYPRAIDFRGCPLNHGENESESMNRHSASCAESFSLFLRWFHSFSSLAIALFESRHGIKAIKRHSGNRGLVTI